MAINVPPKPVLVLEYDSNIEPITLTEAKVFLRLDATVLGTEVYENEETENALLQNFIRVARKQAEGICQRAFTEQIWSFYLDTFPSVPTIQLAKPPVHDVHISYRDTNDEWQLLNPDLYAISHDIIPRVYKKNWGGWPGVQEGTGNVKVTFRCGLYRSTTADSPGFLDTCPDEIKQWIRLKVGELYEHRERSNTEKVTINDFVDNLLDFWTVPSVRYVGW